MEKKRKGEKRKEDSLNTVMYEKRKIRKIITHFEAIPLEMGWFELVQTSLAAGGKNVVKGHVIYLLIFTTRKSFNIPLGYSHLRS